MNRKKENVIIDCDPGIDDSLALMLALSMDELNVLGITIVCGNCPVSMGVRNAKKILREMGRLDIPVYAGAEKPLKREYIDALDTHGADGLGESFLPEVEGPEGEASGDVVSFLSRTFLSEDCSLIALGPLTNIARLIAGAPKAWERIRRIVSMGGSYKSHGNCSPVAEYNYWCDPDAAALVYETAANTGKIIEMVGLDVTRRIVLTPDLLAYLKRLDDKTGTFIEQITKFYFDFHWKQEHLIGCVINDPLAVAYFAKPELCRGISAYTAVETEGISIGQSVVDAMNFYRRQPNARILTEVDAPGFFTLFFSRILGIREEEAELLETLIRPDCVHQSDPGI